MTVLLSTVTFTALLSTPGSATPIKSSQSVSMISTGGSQQRSWTGAAVGWKNWRCNRSARSINSQALAHISVPGSIAAMRQVPELVRKREPTYDAMHGVTLTTVNPWAGDQENRSQGAMSRGT